MIYIKKYVFEKIISYYVYLAGWLNCRIYYYNYKYFATEAHCDSLEDIIAENVAVSLNTSNIMWGGLT